MAEKTKKVLKATIQADGRVVAVVSFGNSKDYISLTDIAKYRNPDFPADVIKNWMRSKSTIEFLGLWEKIHNPDFKLVEFDQFKSQAGEHAFVLPPQTWIAKTSAIGIISRSGRYGGTFAHKDIAFEFASWISAEFKLYIITDYQRLKNDENSRLSLDWNLNRSLAKINYRIHTDAIKENLIPEDLSSWKHKFVYADEADLLNLALFGITAKAWREANPYKKGNIRDYATLEQLIVLVNLENLNAAFIEQKMSPDERLLALNKAARKQMQTLLKTKAITQLPPES